MLSQLSGTLTCDNFEKLAGTCWNVRWINSGKMGNYYTGAFKIYHLRIGANGTDKSALDLVCPLIKFRKDLESISACYAQNRPILPEFLKAHGNARYIQSMRNAPHFFLDAHARRPYVTSAAAWSRAPSSASAPPPPPASPPAPPRPRSGPAPPSSRAPPPPPAGPPPSSTRPAPASPLPVRVRARARARPHDPGADNPTLGPLCVRFRVGGGACGPLRAHRLWPGGWSWPDSAITFE